jgi:hypothetical protein
MELGRQKASCRSDPSEVMVTDAGSLHFNRSSQTSIACVALVPLNIATSQQSEFANQNANKFYH